MRLLIYTLFLLLVTVNVYSQSDWENWDKNYQEIDVGNLLKYEWGYADYVKQGLIDKGKYYLRMDYYLFSAQFTGEKRNVPDDVLASLKRVYKAKGNPEHVSVIDDVKKEYKFIVDSNEYWICILPELDKHFKREVGEEDFVYLYCMFFNEFDKNKLFNMLLMSEFKK